MSLRIGFLGVAHMHAWGYAHAIHSDPKTSIAGVWDSDPARAAKFTERWTAPRADTVASLLTGCDAIIITSENKKHAELGVAAAKVGKPILCEKPLVTTEDEAEALLGAVAKSGTLLMTAFPCAYSPTFERALQRVQQGDIGSVVSVCATNRGSCPFDWFVDKDLSGGGAMIDHVVHVADLLRRLMGKDPIRVQAQTGNKMYGEDWEDTAMLTLEYDDGRFATLDSSWSRPASFKTWGDVTLNIVGEKGTVEVNLFGQEVDVYRNSTMRHGVSGYGSDLDARLLEEFVACVETGGNPRATAEDGLWASRVAIAGYRSVAQGAPVNLLGN